MRRRLVAFLREIGEQEIADHGADIEADRADEGEFRIDDPRVGDRQHDRTGVQVAVDERLAGGEELVFARLRRGLERRVGLEGALVGVELRAVQRLSGASR